MLMKVATDTTQTTPCFMSSRLGSRENRFRDFLDRVRGWCQANTQPTTFRYWLHEPDTLLRVNFESQDQARAFAQAFGGVVLA